MRFFINLFANNNNNNLFDVDFYMVIIQHHKINMKTKNKYNHNIEGTQALIEPTKSIQYNNSLA